MEDLPLAELQSRFLRLPLGHSDDDDFKIEVTTKNLNQVGWPLDLIPGNEILYALYFQNLAYALWKL